MLTLKYLCNSLLPLLPRPLNRQNPQSFGLPPRNSLAGLPVELLLMISNFLSPTERIILSLCNHRLFAILYRPLKEQVSWFTNLAKIPILESLQRSLPDQYVCYLCCKLHTYDNAGCPDGFGLPDFCNIWQERCLMSKSHGVHSSRTDDMEWLPQDSRTIWALRLSFSHVQLTMRSLYYGLESGIHPDALFYTQAREFPVTETYPTYKSISSLEAQIQEDPPSLCLRIQDIILVCNHDSHNREGQPADIFGWSLRVRFRAAFVDPLELFICRHVSIPQLDIIRYTIVDDMVELNWNNSLTSTYHSKCEDCGTEYQLERRTYHGNEQAIVLTRWFNLGPGLSPEDNRWRVLCISSGDDDAVLDPVERLESPRRTWENGAASLRSLEELTKRNVSFLKGHQFKKVMQQSSVAEGIWEIPPKLRRGKWELASIWKARLNQWKRSPLRTPIGGKSDLEATSGEGSDATS